MYPQFEKFSLLKQTKTIASSNTMIDAVLLNGKPDSERKSCFDCIHCKAAVTWWCKNPKAVDWRGTSIPGVHNCPFWGPVKMKSELSWFERIFGNFIYIKQ